MSASGAAAARSAASSARASAPQRSSHDTARSSGGGGGDRGATHARRAAWNSARLLASKGRSAAAQPVPRQRDTRARAAVFRRCVRKRKRRHGAAPVMRHRRRRLRQARTMDSCGAPPRRDTRFQRHPTRQRASDKPSSAAPPLATHQARIGNGLAPAHIQRHAVAAQQRGTRASAVARSGAMSGASLLPQKRTLRTRR